MACNRSDVPIESDLSEKFRRLVEVGLALTSERNVPVLLGRILLEARRFTCAEAGTLYLVTPDGKLQFSVVQNDRLGHSEVLVGNDSRPITIEVLPTSIAGRVTATGMALNIPDVYALPDSCGFQFDSSFDLKTGFHSQSMLVVPMKTPEGGIVGVIQLINVRHPGAEEVTAFPKEHEELVLCLASQAAVALSNANLTRDLQLAYSEAIKRLARAAEFRDQDTGEHIERVSQYAAAIAEALEFPPADVSKILLASTLHDIGKLAIPDSILLKPGKLTDEEYAKMKLHPKLGADILAGSENPMLHLAAEIAISHHEKWDGSGYPRGLKGDEIPLAGQICAVADVFDALSSVRCYKKAMSLEEASEFLRKETGRHFSPRVVDAFFGVMDKISMIHSRFSA
ncbi:MAG: HD domain-containing phosphohydrolase [Verrucomicrobiae bacterium]